MIPLKDDNPTHTFPLITLVLIAACVGVFVLVQPQGGDLDSQIEATEFNFENAAIPCEVLQGGPLVEEELRDTLVGGDANACDSSAAGDPLFPNKNVWSSILYSMFLHGGWLHLGGNMLFLWTFGNNIEDKRGKFQYAIFYLLAGLAATAAHIFVQPSSTVPVVGASGAIAGVMGAYLVLFPNVRIKTLVPLLLFFITDIRAKWLLGFWFVSQFFVNPNDGVAWMAHVGGFVFGVIAGFIWRSTSGAKPKNRYPMQPEMDD